MFVCAASAPGISQLLSAVDGRGLMTFSWLGNIVMLLQRVGTPVSVLCG